MPTRRIAAAIGVASSLAAAACSDQGSAPVTLSEPEAVLQAPFTQISNVVELTDGRIAFISLRDTLFLFADLAGNTLDTVGQRHGRLAPGDTTGEYKRPGMVQHLGGDTLALVDFATQDGSLWNEQGKLLGMMGLFPVAGVNPPVAFDDKGYVYKEDYRAVMGGLDPGAQIHEDSLPVLRFQRKASEADTIAMLKLPAWGEGAFGEERKMVPTVFDGRDLFGVLGDGSVWVARAASNRVDWRSPDGKWQAGPERSYATIPVMQADKEKVMEAAYRSGMPRGVSIQFPFATFKPPFVQGLTNPAGEVWLQRSRSADDSIPVYDVVGRDGKARRAVQLPRGYTVAGFGKDGAVYAIGRGADNEQHIARFKVK